MQASAKNWRQHGKHPKAKSRKGNGGNLRDYSEKLMEMKQSYQKNKNLGMLICW